MPRVDTDHVASVIHHGKEKGWIPMRDTFMISNIAIFLILWFLSISLSYFLIKAAVRDGVQQAHVGLIESVREIEKSVHKIWSPGNNQIESLTNTEGFNNKDKDLIHTGGEQLFMRDNNQEDDLLADLFFQCACPQDEYGQSLHFMK